MRRHSHAQDGADVSLWHSECSDLGRLEALCLDTRKSRAKTVRWLTGRRSRLTRATIYYREGAQQRTMKLLINTWSRGLTEAKAMRPPEEAAAVEFVFKYGLSFSFKSALALP